MKILIVYATTEGQTAKIAERAMQRLMDLGHSVAIVPAGAADEIELSSFDAAILAGSVHVGRYQKELRRYARDRAAVLATMPTLFLSVSLSAAGDDDADWEGLKQIVAHFIEKTGWTPGRVEHIAGAFRFSEYDFFKSWAMRWIASQKGEEIGPDEDREYTDWGRLDAIVGEWTEASAAGT